MEKKPLSHITIGGIIGGIIIVYSMILNFMELTANKPLGYLMYAIILAGIIIAVNMYGKSVDHTASFGKLFVFGFKTTAVVTILVIAFQVVFFLIFPEYKEKFFEIAHEQMLKEGKANEEQIEMGIQMVRKLFWVFIIGGTLFGFVMFGAISSIIGAAVTKKIPPQSPFQQPPLQ
ncbi:MAG: DUF4199 domain-containing protein [Chitinophagaceae bacterium]|nr:DUF4199 domain-containing protein [Chitinophagaceae bacterium]